MAVDPATARLAAEAARALKDRWAQIVAGLLVGFFAFCVIVLLPLFVGIGFVTGMFGDLGGSAGGPPRGPDAALIARYAPIYKAAAAHYGVNWYLLASIHKQETSFTTLDAPGVHSGVNSYGCCAGPMQFNVTNGPPSTWDGYKMGFQPIASLRPADYPQRREPHPSVYDDFDAIAAAARKLHADGATPDLYADGTYRAVCAYIGSCSNVDNCGGPNNYCQVLPRARAWAKEGTATAPATGLSPVPGNSVFPRIPKGVITTRFGDPDAIHHKPHQGVDLADAADHQGQGVVVAFHGGTVSLVKPTATSSGYGNLVCIAHADIGVQSCYAHLADGSVRVHVGQVVRAGQRIATVGATGNVTGPHLHFEIRRMAPQRPVEQLQRICPAPFIGLPYASTCTRQTI